MQVETTTHFDLNNKEEEILNSSKDEGQATLEGLSRLSNSGTIDANNIKHSLFVKRVPRILQVSSYALLLLFLCFWFVSTFNLFFFLNKHANIANQLQANKYMNNRNTNMLETVLALRVLHLVVTDLD